MAATGPIPMIRGSTPTDVQVTIRGIGVNPNSLTILSDIGNELGKAIAQGGLATSEDDMRNAGLPGFIENLFPFISCEFAVHAFDGSVDGV